ncbi:hypothetical protein N9901_00610 [Flavobacteriaceae bacterium]|nr:hypothetical protein [Flavobacteriaceae bacterium]
MKYLLSLSILLFSQFVFSQNSYEITKLLSRIRFSGEEITMENEPNMGFIGHGYEIFGLYTPNPNLYFGLTSYSALTGIRSGFFVFGVSSGVSKVISTTPFTYDLGFFLGGGGGSGAPDGGGLMLRPHVNLSYALNKNLSIGVGGSYITFPSGEINSYNVNIGAQINTNTFLANKINKISGTVTDYDLSNIEINMLSLNLFNFKKGPLKNNNEEFNDARISLLGASFKKKNNDNNFYGLLKLGGAFVGGVDGFMMLLTGVGYNLPMNDNLNLNTNLLLGGAGGGNVQFGGGFAAQLEGGVTYQYNNYLFGLNYGKTYAPNGDFESNHLDISLGKKFSLYSNSKSKGLSSLSSEDFKMEEIGFSVMNRLYVMPKATAKNGNAYQDFFNSLVFEIDKKISENISLLGSTVWAYQGEYGAYAEGWLGLSYLLYKNKNYKMSFRALFGAGGGGDIDLGSGMIYQYGLSLEKKLDNRWSLITNLGQVRPVVNGNFTPVLIDLGFKINISQLNFKNK